MHFKSGDIVLHFGLADQETCSAKNRRVSGQVQALRCLRLELTVLLNVSKRARKQKPFYSKIENAFECLVLNKRVREEFREFTYHIQQKSTEEIF